MLSPHLDRHIKWNLGHVLQGNRYSNALFDNQKNTTQLHSGRDKI